MRSPEKIGMGTRINKQKHEFIIILTPNQQPVGLDVALPFTLAIPMQFMRAVMRRQNTIIRQTFKNFLQFFHRKSSLNTALQALLKLIGNYN